MPPSPRSNGPPPRATGMETPPPHTSLLSPVGSSTALDKLVPTHVPQPTPASEQALKTDTPHWFSLRFRDKHLEHQYTIFDAKKNSKRWRNVLLWGAIWFIVTGGLNSVLSEGDISNRLRPLYIGASMFAVWMLNWALLFCGSSMRHLWQGHVAPFLLFFTLVAMTALNSDPSVLATDQVLAETDNLGVVLVFVAFTVTARIRYFPMLLTSIAYLIADIVIHSLAHATSIVASPDGRETFVHFSNLLLEGALLLYANREYEWYERKAFLTEAKLRVEHRRLLTKNKALVKFIEKNPVGKNATQLPQLDTTTPLERVVKILEELESKTSNDVERSKITDALALLADKGNLFAPNLDRQLGKSGNGLDSETRAYVREFITAGRFGGAKSRRGSNASSGDTHIGHARRSRQGSVAEFGRRSSLSVAGMSNSTSIMSIGDLHALGEMHDTMDDWNFDIFEYNRLSHNQPITYLGQEVFRRLGLAESLGVHPKLFANYLHAADLGYRPLPYHNNIHGADVVHAMYYFLCDQTFEATPIEALSLITASAIHDMDHPGLNNAYLINTSADLSVLYSDRSPLEAYHLACAFSLLQVPELDFTIDLDDDDRALFRKLMIEFVFATDMGYHFDILGDFRSLLSSRGDEGLDMTSQSDRTAVMKMMMKAADLNNPSKSWKIHDQWTSRYFEETFRQGDLEHQAGITISPFMDRTRTTKARCETGFFSFIVVPFWEVFAATFSSATQVPMQQLDENFQQWKDLQQSEQAPEPLTPQQEDEAHSKATHMPSHFVVGANLPPSVLKVPLSEKQGSIYPGATALAPPLPPSKGELSSALNTLSVEVLHEETPNLSRTLSFGNVPRSAAEHGEKDVPNLMRASFRRASLQPAPTDPTTLSPDPIPKLPVEKG
eukprot:TRINITY_DN28178_c0_g1_i1.p1 TRINITY_DN28178_c0_g1~~TRINITY_DN28178_c0_g1_i1.p1  ORF type:complete len:896 (+),score=96.23 TRINITY_DN28178_c0_g1_i1:318-3005(+)